MQAQSQRYASLVPMGCRCETEPIHTTLFGARGSGLLFGCCSGPLGEGHYAAESASLRSRCTVRDVTNNVSFIHWLAGVQEFRDPVRDELYRHLYSGCLINCLLLGSFH
jgi:hypothetical protein